MIAVVILFFLTHLQGLAFSQAVIFRSESVFISATTAVDERDAHELFHVEGERMVGGEAGAGILRHHADALGFHQVQSRRRLVASRIADRRGIDQILTYCGIEGGWLRGKAWVYSLACVFANSDSVNLKILSDIRH